MAGVREKGALPVGCGRPLVRWYDLVVVCVGVCMGVEREPGEKERRERGGLKERRNKLCGGGWFIAKYLVGKLTKIPST